MAEIKVGELSIDPLRNPAVLDTTTWMPESAWRSLRGIEPSYWDSLRSHIRDGKELPSLHDFTPHRGSCAETKGSLYLLATVEDGQQVFLSIGKVEMVKSLGEPFASTRLSGDETDEILAMYPAHADTIAAYTRQILARRGPKALGAVPRLGIGCRMTTSIWPAVWPAMQRCRFASNAIQNSLRELNRLEDLLEGLPPKTNYQFSFGNMLEGHTGSTFEGLWTVGVLEALKWDGPLEASLLYGADADHIMVKRTPDGLERAKRIVEAARHYTFFTLDVSDVLQYEALGGSAGDAESFLEEGLEAKERGSFTAYHGENKRWGGQEYDPDENTLGLLLGKYGRALQALGDLQNHIAEIKRDVPFDIELSIDENPPEIRTCDNLTSATELTFLLLEARRRDIPLTHIAPNFGVEKGVDYRCPDGLEGLERRIRTLCSIAEEFGVMLDCHSGDDLLSPTRKTIGRASKGKIHFKISPSLQVMFGRVLHRMYPDRFRFWWEDSLAYAKREAEGGSSFAAECIGQYEADPNPSPESAVFHHFNFATLGRREADGRFTFRDEFYTLPSDFYEEYAKGLEEHLCEVAEEVLHPEI